MSGTRSTSAPATIASSPIIAGLLQSLGQWQTGGAPGLLDQAFAPYGGMSGVTSALLQDAPGSQGAAAFGRALQANQAAALKRAGARQQLAQGALGLNLMAAKLPAIEAYYRMLGGMMGAQGSQGGKAPSPPTEAVPPGAASTAPSGRPGIGVLQPQFLRPQTAATSQTLPGASAPWGFWQNPLGVMRFGALGSAFGLPGGQQFFDYGKTALQYSPRVAQAMAAAKSPTAIDLMQLRAATAQGNPLLARTALLKYLKDTGAVTVGEYNGNVTTLGGINPASLGISGFNPRTGTEYINGNELPIPGAIPTRQALAGAQARGEAQGDVEEVTDAQGNRYYVPRSALLAGATAAGSRAPTNAGATTRGAPGNQAALGPSEQEFLEGRGRESAEYADDLQKGADAAVTANYSLDQMIADAGNVHLGPGAEARKWVETAASTIGQQFGVAPPKELSNYQSLDKYANQVAFAATRAMGSREAAQIVHLEMQSNPNKELTPQAFADVAGSMQAMNRYLIAKNSFVQAAARKNGGDALGAASQWTRTVDPRVWDLALSPTMGAKWAAAIGPNRINAAWPYLTSAERQAILSNIPPNVRSQWLTSLAH